MALILKNQGKHRDFDLDVYAMIRSASIKRIEQRPSADKQEKRFELHVIYQRRHMRDGQKDAPFADQTEVMRLTDAEANELLAPIYAKLAASIAQSDGCKVNRG